MVKGAARPLVASQDVAHEKAVSATVAIPAGRGDRGTDGGDHGFVGIKRWVIMTGTSSAPSGGRSMLVSRATASGRS
jgi:hypothetical protein